MYAVDDLGDAIDATRNLLLPVRARRWLKLAIVVFFVGGLGMGAPGFPGGDTTTVTDEPTVDTTVEELPDDVLLIAAVLVAVALLLWLLFAFVAAIMEFVFIESLRSNEVHIRRYARENVGHGVRLFGFRVLVGLGSLLVVGAPLAWLFLGLSDGGLAIGLLVLVGLLALFVSLVYVVVMRFTSEFVAPIMLLEDRGVLGGWRRFWSTFRRHWSEYAVYLLLVWIVQAAVGIAAGFIVVFGAIFLAIPFVLLAVGLFMLGEFGVYLAAVVGVVGVLALILFAALVQTPIRSYFQYYALLLLGDTDPELDLIPDQRVAIRSDGGDELGGPGGRDEPPRNGPSSGDDPAESRDDGWAIDEDPREDADERNGWDWDDAEDDRDGDGRNEDDRDENDRGW